jgi:glycosyltransferase involved in cell wall biosynthesis
MKNLWLVMDLHDAGWLASLRQKQGEGGEVVVAAPTFDGRLLAESLQLPYRAYEDIAWNIDKLEINNIAREKANGWHRLGTLAGCDALEAIRSFAGYPLLDMHQSLLLLALQEIIQAHRFMHQVLAVEKPNAVLCGERPNPFLGEPITFITGSNGVEREVVKSINRRRHADPGVFEEFRKNFILRPPPVNRPIADASLFNSLPMSTGPKILIFAWGDYYLDYFDNAIEKLAGQKARICLALIGGELLPAKKDALQRKGVCVFEKASWPVAGAGRIWSECLLKCEQAARTLYGSKTLEEYFSDGFGSYYPSLVSDFLCKQILNLPATVVELLRSESIIRAYSPDMVLNHFCIHPFETCDVLPARALGVPTLTIDHGIHGVNDSQRLTFAAEYYGVSGTCTQKAIHTAVGADDRSILVLGNSRYEGIAFSTEKPGSAKKRLGLDPDRPVCIFCDCSGWSHMSEWRHSTFATAAAIVAVKSFIPGLQIIYRVHHGTRYQGMERYFKDLGDADIHFQVSPNPALLDILSAADLVVSHYSSAVGESLLSGVPVVYLTLHGEPEASYSGCEAIKIADTRERLVQAVSEILGAGLSRSMVRKLAQPYLDIALDGNRGGTSERLSDFIVQLASRPRANRKPGFHDWLDRIETASRFDAKKFRRISIGAIQSINRPPMVSVVIPTKNRHESLGITLQSFIRQSYPQDRYEVLVADNNSSDATRAMVAEWARRFPVPLIYVFEPRAGAHNARNTAAKQARGEIFYFTDDDMIADQELLAQIVRVFEKERSIGTATGRVLPKWESRPPEWVLHNCLNGYLSLNDQGEGVRFAAEDLGVWSCHQAIRRDAFFKSGGFNPDVVNGIAIGDNETGLNIKLRKLGYAFAYNGKAVTHHRIPRSRLTQAYLNQRLNQQGRCDSYSEYRRRIPSIQDLAKQIEGHQSDFVRCATRALSKKASGDITWHLDRAQTNYYLGRIEYDLKLLQDAGWREMVLCDDWLNCGDKFDAIIEAYSKCSAEEGAERPDGHVRLRLSDFRYTNPDRMENLKRFQGEHGLSIIPVSYFEPVPDLREVDLGGQHSHTKIMELSFHYDAGWIDRSVEEIAISLPGKITKNPMIPREDLVVYGQFIRSFKPRRIVEIGSGYSACFAHAFCIRYGIRTEITSIEPSPNPDLLQLAKKHDVRLIQKKVQAINAEEWSTLSQLEPNDILFVDTSHVSTRSSDTNFIFISILPIIKAGVLLHFHDVYLPYDYIGGYYKLGRFYNEQYLLAAMLANSSRFSPLYSTYHNHLHHQREYGASFWMCAQQSPVSKEATLSAAGPKANVAIETQHLQFPPQ